MSECISSENTLNNVSDNYSDTTSVCSSENHLNSHQIVQTLLNVKYELIQLKIIVIQTCNTFRTQSYYDISKFKINKINERLKKDIEKICLKDYLLEQGLELSNLEDNFNEIFNFNLFLNMTDKLGFNEYNTMFNLIITIIKKINILVEIIN